MGQRWPAAGPGALSAAVHAWGLLKEVAIIFITSTIVWPQVNKWKGTQLHSSTENWIKDLLSMASSIRTRPSLPNSLPYQETSRILLSLSIRGQTEWKPQPQKTNQTDHMDHSLSNSIKLWTMPCRATQDGLVMVESSHKTWPTGEGPMDQCRCSLPGTQEKTLHMDITRWSVPKLDWLYSIINTGEVLYSQQKQDQELTVVQIMNSLLPNSDWNWRN